MVVVCVDRPWGCDSESMNARSCSEGIVGASTLVCSSLVTIACVCFFAGKRPAVCHMKSVGNPMSFPAAQRNTFKHSSSAADTSERKHV